MREKITKSLQIIDPILKEGIPVYQILNANGEVTNEEEDPKV